MSKINLSKISTDWPPSQEEIDYLKAYFEKEKAEKNTPFSVVALAILKDEEKGTISLPEQEEIEAMRRFYTQEDKTPFAKVALSILDDFEKIIKEKKDADQPDINTLSQMG